MKRIVRAIIGIIVLLAGLAWQFYQHLAARDFKNSPVEKEAVTHPKDTDKT
jgi:hypothetical protein